MEEWEGLGSVLMSLVALEREKGVCLLPSIFLRIRGPGMVKESGLMLRPCTPTSSSGTGGGDKGGGVAKSLAVLCFVATRGLTAHKLFLQ